MTMLETFVTTQCAEVERTLNDMNVKMYEAAAGIIWEAEKRGNRVHITGIGKPAHVASYMASLLSSTGTPTYFLHALGLVKMAHAFGAFVGVDLVDFLSQGDGLVRALGLTHIAVDALVSDSQCHAVLPVNGGSARRDCSDFRETVFMRRIIPRPCPALL